MQAVSAVELRRVQPLDFGPLYRWRVDNNQFFFGASPTQEQHEAWINAACQDESQSIFTIKVGLASVGTISLYNIDHVQHQAEYGRLIVDQAVRSNGYGSAALSALLDYAFGQLDLHRVYGDIFLSNAAGIAVAKSCGFRPEGVFRDHALKDGAYCDVIRMAILRDSYDTMLDRNADTE